MTNNFKTKTKQSIKCKTPPLGNHAQISLFDKSGFVPFNFAADVMTISAETGVYEVAGMHFQLDPLPKNAEKAMELTLTALAILHSIRDRWHFIRPMLPASIAIDHSSWVTSSASFRDKIDNGIIRATYSPADGLELSIPHMAIWKKCGLAWFAKDYDCCQRNRHNPKPWLGRSCGCP